MKITGKQVKETQKTFEAKELKVKFSEILAIDEDGKRYELKPKDTGIPNPNILYIKKNGKIEFRTELEIIETGGQISI